VLQFDPILVEQWLASRGIIPGLRGKAGGQIRAAQAKAKAQAPRQRAKVEASGRREVLPQQTWASIPHSPERITKERAAEFFGCEVERVRDWIYMGLPVGPAARLPGYQLDACSTFEERLIAMGYGKGRYVDVAALGMGTLGVGTRIASLRFFPDS
jgi:hypothetical protein